MGPWDEANNTSCVINTDYKILWVVNSENYIYKRNALNRAKQVLIRFLFLSKSIFRVKRILMITFSRQDLVTISCCSDAPSSVLSEVQAVEQLARVLGGPARVGPAAEQAQRLDVGPGRRIAPEQDTPPNLLGPQQGALQDIHQVQGGGGGGRPAVIWLCQQYQYYNAIPVPAPPSQYSPVPSTQYRLASHTGDVSDQAHIVLLRPYCL